MYNTVITDTYNTVITVTHNTFFTVTYNTVITVTYKTATTGINNYTCIYMLNLYIDFIIPHVCSKV